ncbi:MAG: hypothetical protein DCC54_03995 [Anaerolineae bacterium]|nr:MAG: hypothetical protein DCC54_03995 [Anaerolineae bacterium]
MCAAWRNRSRRCCRPRRWPPPGDSPPPSRTRSTTPCRASRIASIWLGAQTPNSVSPEDVDLAELLSHVLVLMGKQLDERGIRVHMELPGRLPRVKAVGSQIQQVFINLILNAYDAMPGGGELQVRARAAKGEVEILFEDSGPGVPLSESRNIFEPFVSSKVGGTGLGLTVSYNIGRLFSRDASHGEVI